MRARGPARGPNACPQTFARLTTANALISSPEAGDANPTLDSLDRVAGAFGLRLGLAGERQTG
jgi:hypothetical protein